MTANPLIPVKLRDLLTLIDHVKKGVEHPDVGYEDCERTLEELLQCLNRTAMVPQAVVESALWSCVLLDEEGAYKGEVPVKTLVGRMSPPRQKFNYDVCMWEMED